MARIDIGFAAMTIDLIEEGWWAGHAQNRSRRRTSGGKSDEIADDASTHRNHQVVAFMRPPR